MELLPKPLNITKLCRTCFSEQTNLQEIFNTKITVDENSKTVLDILNLITVIQVNHN